MNSLFTFVLGLLIGWLLEWLIDFFYWRRRSRVNEPTVIPATGDRVQSADKAVLQPAAALDPDDLKIIKGIGPVIERKLNDAGIHTFQQLGNLTAGDLRRILGNTIQRLADEEALLQQARDLAHRK